MRLVIGIAGSSAFLLQQRQPGVAQLFFYRALGDVGFEDLRLFRRAFALVFLVGIALFATLVAGDSGGRREVGEPGLLVVARLGWSGPGR